MLSYLPGLTVYRATRECAESCTPSAECCAEEGIGPWETVLNMGGAEE